MVRLLPVAVLYQKRLLILILKVRKIDMGRLLINTDYKVDGLLAGRGNL